MSHAPRRFSARVITASVLAGGLLPGAVVLGAAAPAEAAVCPPAGGVGSPDAPAPAGAEIAVLGHGYGHNVGMSQYGAQGAALLGCDYDQILRTYYPGLAPALTPLPSDEVRVLMLTAGGPNGYASMLAEGGPVTWTVGAVSVVQPVATTWTVRPDGLAGQAVVGADGVAVPGLVGASDIPILATHDGSVARLTTYTTSGSGAQRHLARRNSHGYVRFVADAAGVSARWVLPVASYLKGIAEMPSSWQAEAQKVQVIAARSYLVGTYSASTGAYLIQPTPADQNWTGASKEEEDAKWGGKLAAAVDATTSGTSGVVMVDATGAVADGLLYTSSDGGWSERADYSFVTPSDHLRQVDDSNWDRASGNPNRAWAVGLTFDQVARAFGFTTVTSITIPPLGDPTRTAVTVTGTRNGVPATESFHGMDARNRLQSVAGSAVKSPGFTFATLTVGGPKATPLTGNWDGKAGDELGWFAGGTVVLRMSDGALVRYQFGRKGDLPVVGDWDGDGTDSVGVVRGGVWYLRNAQAGGAADQAFSFGKRRGDRPVVGHWPGTTGQGIGVIRGNTWYLRGGVGPGAAATSFSWGRTSDVPVVGDWDGAGGETPGLVRGGRWILSDSVSPVHSAHVFLFGRPTDRPVVGDWDANGTATPGVERDRVFFTRDDLSGGAGTASIRFAG